MKPRILSSSWLAMTSGLPLAIALGLGLSIATVSQSTRAVAAETQVGIGNTPNPKTESTAMLLPEPITPLYYSTLILNNLRAQDCQPASVVFFLSSFPGQPLCAQPTAKIPTGIYRVDPTTMKLMGPFPASRVSSAR